MLAICLTHTGARLAKKKRACKPILIIDTDLLLEAAFSDKMNDFLLNHYSRLSDQW